jgi:hypothetical protein
MTLERYPVTSEGSVFSAAALLAFQLIRKHRPALLPKPCGCRGARRMLDWQIPFILAPRHTLFTRKSYHGR